MPARQVSYGKDAREKIKAGVDKIANAVKVTLGPKGRNVMVMRPFGSPMVTKDGVSVAKEVELQDFYENMGASLVREVASKTNDHAGDGTTQATVLAQALVTAGIAAVDAGANPQALRRGIERGVAAMVAAIKGFARPVQGDDILKIATISANDTEIGEKIAEAVRRMGENGVITVEESGKPGTQLEVVDGMQFDNGYVSPYLVTDPKRMVAEYSDVGILVTDQRIGAIESIVDVTEQLASTGQKQLVIIAEDFDGPALNALVLNKLKGAFSFLLVKAPSYGERRKQILEDIAAVTGATVISAAKGMNLTEATIAQLGSAKRVISTKDSTTIVEGSGERAAVEERITALKAEIETTEAPFDQEKLRERLAKLGGGVAVLKVGAASEVEMNEVKHRIEDAVNATRAAVQEGVVSGGGMAYIHAGNALEEVTKSTNDLDEKKGVEILLNALVAPFVQIVTNAGGEYSEILNKIGADSSRDGWDAERDEPCNMFERGIIDPAKVTRCALENAASIAVMVITTECAIVEVPDESRKRPNQ